jgi:hypothetical protein
MVVELGRDQGITDEIRPSSGRFRVLSQNSADFGGDLLGGLPESAFAWTIWLL